MHQNHDALNLPAEKIQTQPVAVLTISTSGDITWGIAKDSDIYVSITINMSVYSDGKRRLGAYFRNKRCPIWWTGELSRKLQEAMHARALALEAACNRQVKRVFKTRERNIP